MSPPPPFTNISLAGSWSIITRETWDNHSKSLQIGLMRRGEPYGPSDPPLPPPPCPEPCHYCHVGDRCRELTITNSIIRSVNCSHHHSTTTTTSSQALITQHQLLPTRQNCKEESREISQISYRTLSLRLSQSSPLCLSTLLMFDIVLSPLSCLYCLDVWFVILMVPEWSVIIPDGTPVMGLIKWSAEPMK